MFACFFASGLGAFGCGGNPEPAVAPASSANVAPPLDVDPMPASIEELEAIAAEPSDARAVAALEKIAEINRAVAASSKHDAATPFEEAAARALRRAFARTRPGEPARVRVAPALVSALDFAGALDEADALRRNLVCPGAFGYVAPRDGAPVHAPALPHDRDAPFWEKWEAAHPKPLDLDPPKAGNDEETRYTAIYTSCLNVPKDPAIAEHTAETWVQIARGHRTRDAGAGPFAVARAIEAYQKAIVVAAAVPKGPAMRHARLGLGEALHHEDRYHAAVDELVRGLALCDDAKSCAPAERRETLMLVADSLVTGDFEGPPDLAPKMARADVFDTEPNPTIAAAKLKVAIDRALDPKIVPQDRAFAPDVMGAVAQTFYELTQYDNALAAFDALQKRAPTHREAPRVLQAIARTRTRMTFLVRAQASAEIWVRVIAAWDDLEAFLKSGSAWREANKEDEDALLLAERVTNEMAPERSEALVSLARSLASAARFGSGPLPTDDATAKAFFKRAQDAWSTKARLAGLRGAQARAVMAQLAAAELEWLMRGGGKIEEARWKDAESLVIRTRDEPDDNDRKVKGAWMLVELSDQRLRYEEKRWSTTKGKEGLRPRNRELKPPVISVRAKESMPAAVSDAVKARDGFAEMSPDHQGGLALREAAGIMLAYGRGDEAGTRLAGALKLVCKQGGFDTFVLAAQVAKATKNGAELKRLGALNDDPDQTCAKTPDDAKKGHALTH